jgi:hypothetical protein
MKNLWHKTRADILTGAFKALLAFQNIFRCFQNITFSSNKIILACKQFYFFHFQQNQTTWCSP